MAASFFRRFIYTLCVLSVFFFVPNLYASYNDGRSYSKPAARKSTVNRNKVVQGGNNLSVVQKSSVSPYQKHIEKNRSSSTFSRNKREYSPSHIASDKSKKSVLVSGNAQTSHITTQSLPQNKPSGVLTSRRPLNKKEFELLDGLANSIPDQKVASRLQSITNGQREEQELNKEDYDFLMDLSKNVSNTHVSFELYKIAERRRKNAY